jgi:hypothetical protein
MKTFKNFIAESRKVKLSKTQVAILRDGLQQGLSKGYRGLRMGDIIATGSQSKSGVNSRAIAAVKQLDTMGITKGLLTKEKSDSYSSGSTWVSGSTWQDYSGKIIDIEYVTELLKSYK